MPTQSGNGTLKPGERYAGFWIRFVAFVVDSVLISVIIGPIAATLYERPDTSAIIAELYSTESLLEALALVVDLLRPASVGEALLNLVLPAAGIVLFWIYRSATPGKLATRTRLADAATGRAPTTRQCVVRYLGYFVSTAGLGLGFLWVAFDKRKQGWHDKIAGTVVVRLPLDAGQ